jgi:hypothetical protein
MTKISDVFKVITAKSRSIDDYSEGNVPFISNGFYNNGVVGHVEPFDDDRVIDKTAICVSAFCEATVQNAPFIGRGNGGSGMTILVPKDTSMSYDSLILYSSLINTNIRWRYSYGRMVTKGRISNELIQKLPSDSSIKFKNLRRLLPEIKDNNKIEGSLKLEPFLITDLFSLQHGDFHSLAAIDEGEYPTVSRIESNNGIVGYYDKIPEANIYPKKTITVSTVTGDSFVQLDPFISTDNVVLLTPLRKFKDTSLFYISLMINKEKWRWMYGRQCYKSKFSTTKIQLPINKKGEICRP